MFDKLFRVSWYVVTIYLIFFSFFVSSFLASQVGKMEAIIFSVIFSILIAITSRSWGCGIVAAIVVGAGYGIGIL